MSAATAKVLPFKLKEDPDWEIAKKAMQAIYEKTGSFVAANASFGKKLMAPGSNVLPFAARNDPVAWELEKLGSIISTEDDGRLHIHCPFESGHTMDSGETATTYFPRWTNRHKFGAFKCMHAHCEGKKTADFLRALGLEHTTVAADDFEVLPEPARTAQPKTTSGIKTAPRTAPMSDIDVDTDTPTTADSDDYVAEHSVSFVEGEQPDYIIKDVLPKGTLAVIYGEPSSGKTFFALDLACAIARGGDWRGKRVHQGATVYLAAEDAIGLKNRIKVYASQHEIALADLPLYVINASPNFMQPESVKKVIKAVRAVGTVSTIFVDTWAQVTPGADENTGKDMGKAMAYCRSLSRASKALVVLIHHSGKDASKGARGWSGLKAAIDAEIEITRYNDDSRVAKVTKLKNGQDGVEFGFKLNTVLLGHDADGDDITSCILEHTAAKPKRERGKRELKGAVQQIVMHVVSDLTIGGPVPVNDVAEAAVNQMPAAAEGKRDTRRQVVMAAITALAAHELLVVNDGNITLLEAE